MPHRTEILNALSVSQEKLFARYRSFSQTELERLCTPGATPDGAAWTPKDRLSHLARV